MFWLLYKNVFFFTFFRIKDENWKNKKRKKFYLKKNFACSFCQLIWIYFENESLLNSILGTRRYLVQLNRISLFKPKILYSVIIIIPAPTLKLNSIVFFASFFFLFFVLFLYLLLFYFYVCNDIHRNWIVEKNNNWKYVWLLRFVSRSIYLCVVISCVN